VPAASSPEAAASLALEATTERAAPAVGPPAHPDEPYAVAGAVDGPASSDRSIPGWFVGPAEAIHPGAADSEAVAAEPTLAAEHVVVQRGDTLLQILMRSGIDRAEAHEVVGTLSTLYDPRRLRVGQAMAVEVERAGDALAAPRLAALSLNLDFGNDLRVERDANGEFAARRVDRELVQTVHAAHAVIDTSLYHTARRHSVPDEALVNLANIFSWDVDFQRDVHPGDSFELVYEQVESPDGEVRGGDVVFASLRLRGRNVHAYRYEYADGRHGYYDADGRSLRKWLMRTPIDGARLSSGFGPRKHPILGYTRMHRGVDFAAPTGTPIYAAGDGVLDYVGRNGAYGNFIRIQHNNEFSTAYAHMSRFADGIKKGSRVRQGQVIALCRHDRPVDRAAPALRGPAERRADQPDVDQAADRDAAHRRRARAVPPPDRDDRRHAADRGRDDDPRPTLSRARLPQPRDAPTPVPRQRRELPPSRPARYCSAMPAAADLVRWRRRSVALHTGLFYSSSHR